MPRWSALATAVLAALAGPGPAPAHGDDAATLFEAKVRPVLAGTCFRCHGGQKTSGGLRVDSRQALLAGGDRGPALIPGDAEGSLLVRAVRHADDDLKMPPDRRLSDSLAADLASWVRAGAPWPESPGTASSFAGGRHWAFEPVRPIEPPEDPAGRALHPIDRFVAAGWRRRGLSPVEPAGRRTLLRRATFDLLGLPPTPGEVAAFEADPSPDAWEAVIDRLLASPHYGERWGRHWMDVAHYADTAGDNADYPIPEARRYRDYIIDAFNADLPYDQFVREQVAGDILAREAPDDRYAEKVIATGFLGLSRRYATAPYELWHLTLEDAIETTGRAVLGLTLRCARCHDHKFDPITTREYYALYGVFASTAFPYAGSEEFQSKNLPRERFVPLLPPDRAAPLLDAHRRRIAALEAALPAIGHEETARVLGDELKALKRPGLPRDVPGAYAVSEGTPTDVPVQRGGEPSQPGEVVPRGLPTFLGAVPPPPISAGSSGRKELAEWLTRPDHPLTARVMVNRIWQHHFGRGIVATPSNFGLQGAPPTHPELLDWLAARFVACGWSVKAMHRLILTSEVYRLSSREDASATARDPANDGLWRHERRRLDAEAIRDAMLCISGRLDRSRPGDHPFPPIARWGWTQHNAFKAVYPTDRRSVYLMTQRLVKHPFLALFDGPDTNHTTDVRTSATVPLQALFLLNNPFVREQAEGLRRRVWGERNDPAERVALAQSLAWGRPPEPDEIERALAFLREAAAVVRGSGASPDEAGRQAWDRYGLVLLTANEFFYID
jgi:hypothetical protein